MLSILRERERATESERERERQREGERKRERESVWVASTCQTYSNYFRMASAVRRATGEHSLSVYYRKRFVASIYSCACFKMILFTMHG